MGEGDDGEIGRLADAGGESQEQRGQPLEDQVHGLSQADCVGIVLDIHRGGPQVDDAPRCRALLRKGPHFRHQIVVDFGFNRQRTIQVDGIHTGT